MYKKLKPFRVIITTAHGLNILLSSKNPKRERMTSHFMQTEDAIAFAEAVQQAVELYPILIIGKCSKCEEPCFDSQDLFMIDDGEYVHSQCISEKMKYMDDTRKITFVVPKSHKIEKSFNFSNFGTDCKWRFRFEISTDSDTIHIITKEYCDGRKSNFHFTPHECHLLIQDIKDQVEKIECSIVGVCKECTNNVHLDNTRYVLRTGELIHGYCMDKFIRSEKSASVTFPVKKIKPNDCFGFIRLYGETCKSSILSENYDYDTNPTKMKIEQFI